MPLDIWWEEGRRQEILSQKYLNYNRGDTWAQKEYWLRAGGARLAGNLGDGALASVGKEEQAL